QNDLLLSGSADNINPTESTSDTSDMAALVGHFLSAGVPISISQPNGETAPCAPTEPEPPAPATPAPVVVPPPITPQRSGFVITSGELPAIEAAPSSIS